MSSAEPNKTSPGRLVYIDSLRAFLTVLVICHHLAVAHGGAGRWYYKVPPPEGSLAPVWLTLFVAANQSFFMSLFFTISAFVTPISYDKRGPAGYLGRRFVRLGVPLVVYIVLLHPALQYFVYRFQDKIALGFVDFLRARWLLEARPGHLWFVLTLLVFAVCYVAERAMFGKRAGARDRPFPGNGKILAFVVLAGGVTFLVRLVFPVGWSFFDLQFGYFPLYVCMYVFGVCAYRYAWFDHLRGSQVALWVGAAALLIVPLPIVVLLKGVPGGKVYTYYGGFNLEAAAYAFWEPVLCVGISLGLIWLFQRYANRPIAALRPLIASAYLAYILHAFFVVGGTYLLADWPLDPIAKVAMLCPPVVVACFAVSELLRRIPYVNRVV